MTPVDTSVTSTGNSVLSALDIAKMECLYYCDGTNPGTCGGHKYGEDSQKISAFFPLFQVTVELSSLQACREEADASG